MQDLEGRNAVESSCCPGNKHDNSKHGHEDGKISLLTSGHQFCGSYDTVVAVIAFISVDCCYDSVFSVSVFQQ